MSLIIEVSSRNWLNFNDQLLASVTGCSISISVISISWSFVSDLKNVTGGGLG